MHQIYNYHCNKDDKLKIYNQIAHTANPGVKLLKCPDFAKIAYLQFLLFCSTRVINYYFLTKNTINYLYLILFKASKTREPSPRIQLTLFLYEEIISHILKDQYDEIFKEILKTKIRKPLNEILTLSLYIDSLRITDNILGLHLAILRSE